MFNHYIKLGMVGAWLFLFNAHTSFANSFHTIASFPQQNKETLKVVDEFGKPLAGAKVYSSQQQLLATTDEFGEAELEYSDTEISIQHPEYLPKIINHNGPSTVYMVAKYLFTADSINILNEMKDLKKSLGAISTVNHNQIKSTPTPLYLNALTGRLAGFYTQEISGFRSARTSPITFTDLAGSLPGEATKYSTSLSDNSEIAFQLRGQNPITIIDGVQREIYSIDPENIESITVIKDALSSLLLGQRSSRGILQITTHRGKIGAPRVSFTAQTGLQESLKQAKPLEAYQYAYLYNEALLNSGRQPVYSQEDYDAYKTGSSPYLLPNVNWYDAILKEFSPITKYNLGVNGGIKNARYAISLSYLNQEGMFNSSDQFDYDTNLEQSRYLINSTIDVDVTNDFTIGLQLFGRIQNGRQPGAGSQEIFRSLFATPNNAYPIFNPDGSYGGSSVFKTNLYQQATGSGYLLDNTRDILANLDLNYKFDHWLPGLYAQGKVNVSSSSSSIVDRSRRQPVFDVTYNDQNELTYVRFGDITDQPNSFSTTSSANFFYFQGALGYDREIAGEHQVGGKLFFDQQTSNYQFDLPAIYTNVAATGNYAYKNKYFAEVAVNYSGFNRFKPQSKFGLFYAAGLGWDLAQESFFADQSNWLDQFKLKVTYGRTGNVNEGALGYYSWRTSFGQGGIDAYEFGSEYTRFNSLVEKGLANIGATWEKGNKLNVGLDVSLLKSKFKLSAAYYRDSYSDLLQQRGSTIELIGISYPNENIGKNLYEGQEIELTYQNHLGNFNYFIAGNVSRMRTEVIYMNEVFQKYSWNRRTGMPVGQTFGYLADGLIQNQEQADVAPRLAGNVVNPGDVKLVDLNGDGVINIYDQTAIGNTKPLVFYGTTLGFNFAGIDCSILLQGVTNRTYQQTDYSFGSNGEGQGYDYMLGRWTPETATTATYPRLTIGFDPTNTPYLNNSSYWTRSGAYLRVRHVDLGYTFPYAWSKKINLAALRIFANAQNLFTSTSYDRLDPEIYGTTAYPIQRIINFGVNIKL